MSDGALGERVGEGVIANVGEDVVGTPCTIGASDGDFVGERVGVFVTGGEVGAGAAGAAVPP